MLAVPPVLLDILNLEAGAEVGLAVEKGRLIVESPKRKSYSLAQLIREHKPNRRAKATREWLQANPAGRELL
jgi:antitoxin ChpS